MLCMRKVKVLLLPLASSSENLDGRSDRCYQHLKRSRDHRLGKGKKYLLKGKSAKSCNCYICCISSASDIFQEAWKNYFLHIFIWLASFSQIFPCEACKCKWSFFCQLSMSVTCALVESWWVLLQLFKSYWTIYESHFFIFFMLSRSTQWKPQLRNTEGRKGGVKRIERQWKCREGERE